MDGGGSGRICFVRAKTTARDLSRGPAAAVLRVPRGRHVVKRENIGEKERERCK